MSTEFIMGLKPEQIQDLGGEDEITRNDRKRTKAKIERLEAAKDIAEEALRMTRP